MTRRTTVNALVAAVVAIVVAAVGWLGVMSWQSRIPETYSVLDHGHVELGGGTGAAHQHEPGQGTSVATLGGPQQGAPGARFSLTARAATIELASGRTVQALTFDGRSPGPELRVRRGDLVEVTLANDDVAGGVTIHWHGVDVPNAEDGVAGVTQNAVLPGERHVYRFRAEQVGTFWYHTHQVSSKEVRRGLFGAFVIEPTAALEADLDIAVLAHTYDGVPTLDAHDGVQRIDAAPGSRARLRLVNTDNSPHRFAVVGAPFHVIALDGTDLAGPEELEGVLVKVPGGSRADVELTIADSPVWLSLDGTPAALAFNTDRAPPPPPAGAETFDPLSYGTRTPTPFGATSEFDRRFQLTISEKPGFFDGKPGRQWALNSGIYPDVPTFHVEQGDLVEVTMRNDTDADHPMHLHGHHLLVLSRDGEPASGSPWWPDTLNLEAGEEYRVAFRADNPGIWMDHCHNLRHAADGLTMHVAYAGVFTPFVVGGDHGNAPE